MYFQEEVQWKQKLGKTWILGILSLQMFKKRIAESINWTMCGQRNRNPFMVSPSYTVPELTRIYRVVGDNVHLKVRFNFIRRKSTP